MALLSEYTKFCNIVDLHVLNCWVVAQDPGEQEALLSDLANKRHGRFGAQSLCIGPERWLVLFLFLFLFINCTSRGTKVYSGTPRPMVPGTLKQTHL